MERLFPNGHYRGQGHWIDQRTDGLYRAAYTITDGPQGSKIHEVQRTFLTPDGAIAYEEHTRVSFEPLARGSVVVTIHGRDGTVSGRGYVFEHAGHYDVDVTADNHLEFTFHADEGRLRGLGSATNRGNRTYWEETVARVPSHE